MVIDDLDLFRPYLRPPEAYTELIVDPDGMLAEAITFECLQAIVRRRSEFVQGRGRVQHFQRPERDWAGIL
jgi:hypothetical protein